MLWVVFEAEDEEFDQERPVHFPEVVERVYRRWRLVVPSSTYYLGDLIILSIFNDNGQLVDGHTALLRLKHFIWEQFHLYKQRLQSF